MFSFAGLIFFRDQVVAGVFITVAGGSAERAEHRRRGD